jgi:hypothetical protein
LPLTLLVLGLAVASVLIVSRTRSETNAAAEGTTPPPPPKRLEDAPPSAPVANTPDAAVPVYSASLLKGKTVAVLEFKSHVSHQEQSANNYTDHVRSIVVTVAPTARVFTRENIQLLLQGRDLADCEGECEVETARRLGADLVISGDLRRVGVTLVLAMRLHETASARLLSGASASGSQPEDVDSALELAVQHLLRR